MGLEIVDLLLRRGGNRWLVRIDIDRPGAPGVGVADCEKLSRAVEKRLDEENLVDQSYVLEVSSPGLNRPIRTDDDVRRNKGRRIVVETLEPVQGRRCFRGVLLGIDGDALRLLEEGEDEIRIPRGGIVRAHQEVPF